MQSYVIIIPTMVAYQPEYHGTREKGREERERITFLDQYTKDANCAMASRRFPNHSVLNSSRKCGGEERKRERAVKNIKIYKMYIAFDI